MFVVLTAIFRVKDWKALRCFSDQNLIAYARSAGASRYQIYRNIHDAYSAKGFDYGALIGLGIPEYHAKRYEGRMRKGGILLSVHADDHEWANKGRHILEQTGAEDIASTTETKGDFGNTDRPTALGSVEPVPEKVTK
jgi:hypothetical protein